MEKFYKIGELARLYHVSTDILRYYEEQNLLTPKRAPNGYRLYSIKDIWKLNVIRDLRKLNIPVEKIRDYLAEHNAASTQTLLENELALIEAQIQQLKQMQNSIRQRIASCQRAYSLPLVRCFLQDFPKRPCHTINKGYTTDEEMDPLIQQLQSFDPENLYIWGNDGIGSVISLNAAQNGRCRQYESVFILHPRGQWEIPAGKYLCLGYSGDSMQNAVFVPRLFTWAKNHQFIPIGPLLEFLRTDIHISGKTSDHITELQLRVETEVP